MDAISKIGDSINIPVSKLIGQMKSTNLQQAIGMYAMLLRFEEDYHRQGTNDYWAYLVEFLGESISDHDEWLKGFMSEDSRGEAKEDELKAD